MMTVAAEGQFTVATLQGQHEFFFIHTSFFIYNFRYVGHSDVVRIMMHTLVYHMAVGPVSLLLQVQYFTFIISVFNQNIL